MILNRIYNGAGQRTCGLFTPAMGEAAHGGRATSAQGDDAFKTLSSRSVLLVLFFPLVIVKNVSSAIYFWFFFVPSFRLR